MSLQGQKRKEPKAEKAPKPEKVKKEIVKKEAKESKTSKLDSKQRKLDFKKKVKKEDSGTDFSDGGSGTDIELKEDADKKREQPQRSRAKAIIDLDSEDDDLENGKVRRNIECLSRLIPRDDFAFSLGNCFLLPENCVSRKTLERRRKQLPP